MAHDACTPGLSTTRYTPTFKKQGVLHPRPGARKVDCFYVYPTVSDQKTDVANKSIDPEIKSIALYQAARYSQECRVYAPVYRQRTIQGIQAGVQNGAPRSVAEGGPGYGDVLEAWRTYLKSYNKGRPFVIIGHSQGSFVLRQLVRDEIDSKPAVRKNLLSAILLGGNVEVPKGKDVGGDFKHIPACRSAKQLGCVVAFSTYTETPPADSLFGRTPTAGTEALCTNPAALGGGSASLDTLFPGKPFAPGTLISLGISLLGVKVPTAPTPWVEVAGGYRGQCSSAGGAQFLKLTAQHGAPTFKASPTAQWGTHLVDANIALGNLVKLVRTEAAAFARK
jgi:hypothetical protein